MPVFARTNVTRVATSQGRERRGRGAPSVVSHEVKLNAVPKGRLSYHLPLYTFPVVCRELRHTDVREEMHAQVKSSRTLWRGGGSACGDLPSIKEKALWLSSVFARLLCASKDLLRDRSAFSTRLVLRSFTGSCGWLAFWVLCRKFFADMT